MSPPARALVLVVLILSAGMVGLAPTATAQAVLSQGDWSNLITLCADYFGAMWSDSTDGHKTALNTADSTAWGLQNIDTGATASFGDAVNLAAGGWCVWETGHADEDHFESDTNVAAREKFARLCTAELPDLIAGCVDATGRSGVRECPVTGACAGTNVVKVMVAEFTAATTVSVPAGTSNICGSFRHTSALTPSFPWPIDPEQFQRGRCSATTTSATRLFFSYESLLKPSRAVAENNFPPVTDDNFFEGCAPGSATSVTTPEFYVRQAATQGFAFFAASIRSSDVGQTLSLTATSSDPDIFPVTTTIETGANTVNGTTNTHAIWRIGFYPRGANSTPADTVSFTVDISGAAKTICTLGLLGTTGGIGNPTYADARLFPQQSRNANTGAANSWTGTTRAQGLLFGWSTPGFLTTLSLTVSGEDAAGDTAVLVGASVVFVGVVGTGTVSCITDTSGECSIEDVLDRTGRFTVTHANFPEHNFQVAFALACNNTDCPTELLLRFVDTGNNIVDVTDLEAVTLDPESAEFAAGEILEVTVSRNYAFLGLVALYRLNEEGDPVQVGNVYEWTVRNANEIAFAYPNGRSLQTSDEGKYVLAVATAAGADNDGEILGHGTYGVGEPGTFNVTIQGLAGINTQVQSFASASRLAGETTTAQREKTVLDHYLDALSWGLRGDLFGFPNMVMILCVFLTAAMAIRFVRPPTGGSGMGGPGGGA